MHWRKPAEIWSKNFRTRWTPLKHFGAVSTLLNTDPTLTSPPKGLAQKDQPIFQAAMACQASHLLTGDLKDFGPFMNQPGNTFGICIQTVAEFLNFLV